MLTIDKDIALTICDYLGTTYLFNRNWMIRSLRAFLICTLSAITYEQTTKLQ